MLCDEWWVLSVEESFVISTDHKPQTNDKRHEPRNGKLQITNTLYISHFATVSNEHWHYWVLYLCCPFVTCHWSLSLVNNQQFTLFVVPHFETWNNYILQIERSNNEVGSREVAKSKLAFSLFCVLCLVSCLLSLKICDLWSCHSYILCPLPSSRIETAKTHPLSFLFGL